MTATAKTERYSASRVALWTLISQLTMQLSGIVTGIFLARALGPTGRGEINSILIPNVLVVSIMTLGNSYSLIYHVPRGLKRETLAANIVWFSLVAGGIGATVLWLAAPRWMHNYPPQIVHLTQIFGVSAILSIVTELGRSVMIGREQYAPVNAVRVAQRVLAVVGYVLCWLTVGFNVTVATWVNVFIAAVLCTYTLAYLLHGQRNAVFPDLKELATLQGYGVKVFPGALVNLMNLRYDQVVMIGLCAPSVLGLYAVSVTVAELLGFVGSAFSNLLEGRGANASPEEARRFFQKTSRITILATTTLAVMVSLCAERLILLVYGREFHGAGLLTAILGYGTIAQAFNRNTSGFLSSIGHPMANLLAQGISFGFTVILVPILVRWHGAEGAAIASNIAYFAATITLGIYLRVALGYSLTQTLLPTVADVRALTRLAGRLITKATGRLARNEG